MLSHSSSLKPSNSSPLTISHQFSISTEPVLSLSPLPPNTLLLNKRHLSHSFKKSASIALPQSPPEPFQSPPILNRLRHQYLTLVKANNYLQSIVKDKIHDSRQSCSPENTSYIKSNKPKERASLPKKEQQLIRSRLLCQRRKSEENENNNMTRIRQTRAKKRYLEDQLEEQSQTDRKFTYKSEDQQRLKSLYGSRNRQRK